MAVIGIMMMSCGQSVSHQWPHMLMSMIVDIMKLPMMVIIIVMITLYIFIPEFMGQAIMTQETYTL